MSFLLPAERLPLPQQAWRADIPELFGIEGGYGYRYVGETHTLRLSADNTHQRAGSEGISLCAMLILLSEESIAVSHVVESNEGIHGVPFRDYSHAVIVHGSRGYTGPALIDDIEHRGFRGEVNTLRIPNHRYSFAMYVSLDGPRLAVAQRDAEPAIQWYDISIPS